jgi:hypothetical protein
MTEGRRQMTDDRRQKTDDERQMTEDGRRRSEAVAYAVERAEKNTEFRRQNSE